MLQKLAPELAMLLIVAAAALSVTAAPSTDDGDGDADNGVEGGARDGDFGGLRCYGLNDGCCTADNPCVLGDGDCDDDVECQGNARCGKPGSCNRFIVHEDGRRFSKTDSCCVPMYCDGGDSCCGTDGYRCKEDEGDCDQDSDCEDGLLCTTNSCRRKKDSLYDALDDCCTRPYT